MNGRDQQLHNHSGETRNRPALVSDRHLLAESAHNLSVALRDLAAPVRVPADSEYMNPLPAPAWDNPQENAWTSPCTKQGQSSSQRPQSPSGPNVGWSFISTSLAGAGALCADHTPVNPPHISQPKSEPRTPLEPASASSTSPLNPDTHTPSGPSLPVGVFSLSPSTPAGVHAPAGVSPPTCGPRPARVVGGHPLPPFTTSGANPAHGRNRPDGADSLLPVAPAGHTRPAGVSRDITDRALNDIARAQHRAAQLVVAGLRAAGLPLTPENIGRALRPRNLLIALACVGAWYGGAAAASSVQRTHTEPPPAVIAAE
jgi:hypothetical protein